MENNENSEIRENQWKESFMKLALAEGQAALIEGEIPVGCVIVCDDKIVGRGYNKTNETRNGTRHAEMNAIDKMIFEDKFPVERFRECELFVTCEPCIMCAAALGKMGLKKVHFGCSNERFGGNGSILSVHTITHIPGQHPYPIETGLLEAEAIGIFQTFYSTENRRAPEAKRRRKK